MRKWVLTAALLLSGICGAIRAEYAFFSPRGAFTVEVSLENAPHLRLPAYRNAIVSLVVVGDYAVGGTAAKPGLSPFVFAVSLSKKRLVAAVDLASVVAGQRSIQSGLGRGNGGVLYAGTIPDQRGDSGHLIEVRLQGEHLQVTDKGIPVETEGIFSLASDPARGSIYGVTHPSGLFFRRSITGTEYQVFKETAPSPRTLSFLHSYALDAGDVLSRGLALDRGGRVYGSMPLGKIFRYDPASDSIEILDAVLPETWGRKPLAAVDAWAVAPDGTLYGGNAGDGQLFKLDPGSGQVTNLGKPAMMPRLRGLAFGADGRLYGVTGAAPGYTHLFVYDPTGRGFSDLGNPRFTMTEPGIEQGIAWRGFQIGTLAASEDGRYIVMGEDESLSQLMVFPVQR
jgi:hypothetical protein